MRGLHWVRATVWALLTVALVVKVVWWAVRPMLPLLIIIGALLLIFGRIISRRFYL